MSRSKITTNEFICKARLIHGDKYDYSLAIYTKRSEHIKIICRIHGLFEQTAGSHLNGRGCKDCGLNRLAEFSASHKHSIDTIIKKAQQIHGDKYDYSLAIYNGYHKKFTVICRVHGEFYPTPSNHISNKSGCPKCSAFHRNIKLKKTFQDFITEANSIHNNKYSYIETDDYSGDRTAVLVVCPEHGIFKIGQRSHLNGKGCKKCGLLSISKKLTIGFSEFIRRANNIYNYRYKYDGTSYSNIKGTIVAVCPDHGDFLIRVESHLSGSKCPRCSINLFESSVIEFIDSIGVDVELFNRTLLGGYEIDILIKSANVGIECHGLYWHSFNSVETKSERFSHFDKHELCINNNLKLLQVFEHEWRDKQNIVKSIILAMLNMATTIYGRKCKLVIPDIKIVRQFLNNNHLMGYKNYDVAYCLMYDDEVCAMLTLSHNKKYEWEISRFVNKVGAVVVGGLSKLFNRFVADYNPIGVVSYADRRFFNGNSYRHLGFRLDGVTKPNYFYTLGKSIYSRQQFQKHKLAKKLDNFNPDLTEAENMFNNGYRRIWDAGHYRFIYD